MTEAAIIQKILKCLKPDDCFKQKELWLNKKLGVDLGIDGLDLVEAVIRLEREFNTPISDNDLEYFANQDITVGQLKRYITRRLIANDHNIPEEVKLLHKIPDEQVEAVFSQKDCYIDSSFIGFIDIYRHLSEIIPKHFIVIDLGCGYNAQSFYFTEHKRYVAVDNHPQTRFQSPNCVLVEKSILEFISEDLKEYDLCETFAICSYVPGWGGDNGKLVRETFPNVFVYYPHDHNLHKEFVGRVMSLKGKKIKQ